MDWTKRNELRVIPICFYFQEILMDQMAQTIFLRQQSVYTVKAQYIKRVAYFFTLPIGSLNFKKNQTGKSIK